MKATLIVGSARVTVNLSMEALRKVAVVFVDALECMVCEDLDGECTDDDSESEPTAPPETTITPKDSSGNTGSRIYFFQCNCGNQAAVKMPEDTREGDVLSCRCGELIEIRSVQSFSGACPSCGRAYHDLRFVNGFREYRCNKCLHQTVLEDTVQ